MSITSYHIIRQQYLHAGLSGTESDGLALQRKLSGLCEHRLNRAIAQVLDRCSPPGGHVHIERLEIDVGSLTLDNLEADLPRAVAEALQKALQEQIPSGKTLLPVCSGNLRYVTEQQAINEVFLFFLRTGRLPWSFRLPEGRSLEQVILGSLKDATQSGVTFNAAKDSIFRALISKTVRKRLVRQFSSVFLETLLSLLSSRGRTVIDEILQVLRSSDTPHIAEVKYFERFLWESVFAHLAVGKVPAARSIIGEAWRARPFAKTGPEQKLANLLERHWPEVTGKASAAADRNAGIKPTPPDTAGSQRTLPRPSRPSEAGKNLSAMEDTVTGKEPIAEEDTSVALNSVAGKDTAAGEDPIAGEGIALGLNTVAGKDIAAGLNAAAGEDIDAREDIAAGEGIYIGNAGMVLLHPFLPRLFDALGIAAQERLLQPERALCLLHYLTTGKTSVPEYELTLPKILCNVPPKTPVERDVELTAIEQKEAAALLEAVIRHWEVLQNTSPDGLRGTFLVRPGKVSVRDGDWLLQVESRTCDILLDRLPWGISMIKLPWMKKVLWVEWK